MITQANDKSEEAIQMVIDNMQLSECNQLVLNDGELNKEIRLYTTPSQKLVWLTIYDNGDFNVLIDNAEDDLDAKLSRFLKMMDVNRRQRDYSQYLDGVIETIYAARGYIAVEAGQWCDSDGGVVYRREYLTAAGERRMISIMTNRTILEYSIEPLGSDPENPDLSVFQLVLVEPTGYESREVDGFIAGEKSFYHAAAVAA